MDSTQSEPTITRGRETPSLLPGPQRLHYQFSAALPQTHLTFVSVLQGLAFGLLLFNIPLPSENASWPSILDFWLKQYLYLPYIISALIIITIWNQFVHASLFVTWPLSISQSILLFLLTMAEILTFGQLKFPQHSLSSWLFGLGWVGIFGGIIRIHNIRWYHPRTPSPLKGRKISIASIVKAIIKTVCNFIVTKEMINNTEIRDGLFYSFAGLAWVGIGILYRQLVHLIPFFSWFILVVTIAILFLCIWMYIRLHQANLQVLAKDSDLDVLPHGLIKYKEGSSQVIVHQQTNPLL